ncbi:WecA-like glycosyltransferase [Polystyrenella longa]|uniref:WecA-like glycosyltransferase n=1 Tax=Polystyrenella longa TaxID=2528007 RepID=A0A518CL18_9PLAN|nr:MraY family glycosyltransferase [Polystyrenella longa]QDU79922.1 WecA-like glycosyltransferase [Polystyrenella longa]
MIPYILASAGSSFVLSLLLTGLMRWLAPKLGFVDQPAARKLHLQAKPLGGGIAIFLGVLFPLLSGLAIAYALEEGRDAILVRQALEFLHLDELFSLLSSGILYRSTLLWKILAGGSCLVLLGLLDDRFHLAWWSRLIAQLLIAGWLVSSGIELTLFLPLPWITISLSVLWIVVLINAFNFIDNMDGLSAGTGLISASMFAALMLSYPNEPRWLVAGLLLSLIGSLAGFLVHNWTPAQIFMGDAGSTFIGLSMAAVTMLGTYYSSASGRQHAVLAPLCILAVPLYDFSSVICIRLWEGRSPFQPDKNHFSHRLVALGLNNWQAVLTIYLTTLITGLTGILLFHADSWFTAIVALLATLGVLLLIAILELAAAMKVRKLLQSGSSPETSLDSGTWRDPSVRDTV